MLDSSTLKGDIFGGITAAIVALPLALAFGVASGLGPLAGLYGAIIVGFFAAIFGGTTMQISGPTGPMTVIIAAAMTQFTSNVAVIFTIIMLGGVFQIIIGMAGFGRYIKLVPQTVVSGFMTGIGLIVIIMQIGPLLGYVSPAGSNLIKVAAVPAMMLQPNAQALILGLISFVIMTLTPKAIRRYLPPSLLAILLGTLAGVFYFTQAPIIGEIPSGLPSLRMPAMNLSDFPSIIRFALILAFLGSIDSLLTSLVADSMTRTNHDSNQELIGQGIGNMLAGAFGGVAGAGATMRTLVNIQAGGRTRLSGVVHAVVLLVLVLAFADLAKHIPLAVLAGILMKVGIDIIDWRNLKRLTKLPRTGVVIMLTTLSITVFVDLITAVAVGIVMASVLFASKMAKAQMESVRFSFGSSPELDLSEEEATILDAAEGRIVLFQMIGPLSFTSIRDVSQMMQSSQKQEVLVIDLTQVPFIDSSAAAVLEEITERLLSDNDQIVIFGGNQNVISTLQKTDVIKLIGSGQIVIQRREALRIANELIKQD